MSTTLTDPPEEPGEEPAGTVVWPQVWQHATAPNGQDVVCVRTDYNTRTGVYTVTWVNTAVWQAWSGLPARMEVTW